jgi:RecA-family ATPase
MRGIKSDNALPENDLREIVFKKNQYGPIGERVILKYQSGMFLPAPGMTSLDQLAEAVRVQDVFLTLSARFTREGRNVSSNLGRGYAPAAFAEEEVAQKAKVSKDALRNAMLALFREERIWNEQYGQPSRPHYRIRLK